MRFLHTADWHIGRKLGDYDLQVDQQYIYEQLVKVASSQNVDAIVIAGDLYDRSLPNEEAVTMVNAMLADLNREHSWPVLAISGNHDSAVRVNTGRDWYQDTGLYINTTLRQAFTPVVIDDTQFFLLPYFEPIAARQYFEDDSLTNINAAMKRVTEEMLTLFDPTKKHVLVAHFFAAGGHHSDSEVLAQVGGLDAVALADLQAFDYVALGHLHNRHALNEEAVQYAGSLLKFSVSEATQEKGVYIVDTTTMKREFVALPPLYDLQHLSGYLEDFRNPDKAGEYDHDAYTAITLSDQLVIPNVMRKLRDTFPRMLTIERAKPVVLETGLAAGDPHLAPEKLLDQFMQDIVGAELTAEQRAFAKQTLAELEGDH